MPIRFGGPCDKIHLWRLKLAARNTPFLRACTAQLSPRRHKSCYDIALFSGAPHGQFIGKVPRLISRGDFHVTLVSSPAVLEARKVELHASRRPWQMSGVVRQHPL